MENTLSFNVKENSIQEFANNYIVVKDDPRNIGRNEVLNPYCIIGKDKIYVKKSIMEVINNDPVIEFQLYDESRNFRTKLIHIYQYSIDAYDDICLELNLIDFKVEVAK